MEKDRLASQKAMVKLSRKGKQVMAANSGHHVQIEEPEVVAAAIKSAWGAAGPGRLGDP